MALPRKLTTKIYEIQAHTQKVTSLDLGETGRVLVTGGQDRSVNLWALGNEQCFMSLTGHNGQVDCVKFASGDDLVYSSDENGIIKRWDLNSQPGCVTFYGHMKSVRTLDFHPHGNYILASGSNDTTVRLWDVRKSDSCVEKYRGHIANVNSVQFSPDGSWIASAGTEGSVIIWDIRTRKKIIEFQEHASPVTCITFHPFEFLLAAGRNDGTVDLYDLEAVKLISRTEANNQFNRHTVKCITFSENGECCFVGSADGISVIGWEPDKEFDHIESAWSILGDMKVINKKLICGSYEKETVVVHAINLSHVIPFYNPSNIPFSYNHSSRKSFSRGAPKSKLSVKSPNNNDSPTISLVGGVKEIPSPSSLSIEMIDEYVDETAFAHIPNASDFDFEQYAQKHKSYLHSLPAEDFDNFKGATNSVNETENLYLDNYTSDLDYYPMKSSTSSNDVMQPEREDFPVNNAQPPDYAPKMDFTNSSNVANKSTKSKISVHVQRKGNQSHQNKSFSQSRKMSNSTTDLHSFDDNNTSNYNPSRRTTMSRNGSPTRNYTAHHNNNNYSKMKSSDSAKESNHGRHNRKIPVQILTKPPPTRSKTSFDLRASTAPTYSLPPSSMTSIPSNASNSSYGPQTKSNNSYEHKAGESSELNVLTAYHDRVYQELSNRFAKIQYIRNSTKPMDMTSALRQVIKMRDHPVMVDLLGAILEKPASWNLDMCVLLLPEIYELLQSDHKFHFTRACDTLRIILSNFLPIIQANTDPWSSARSYGGVDIPREERQKKCMECAHWLTKIKLVPDNNQMGSNLVQLQNLIINI